MTLFNQTILNTFHDILRHKLPEMYIYSYTSVKDKLNKTTIKNEFNKTCNPTIDMVGGIYIRNSVDNIFKDDDNSIFDFMIITSSPVDKKMSSKQFGQTNSILGFVISEKGECKQYTNSQSINLVCSSQSTIKGELLLGIFLYCIIHDNHSAKSAVLELAGSYLNIAGLCSYTKMGFTHDETMYNSKCFTEYSNLPMFCDLSKYGRTKTEQSEKLINMLSGKSPFFDKHEICTKYDRSSSGLLRQHLHAIILNANILKLSPIPIHRQEYLGSYLYTQLDAYDKSDKYTGLLKQLDTMTDAQMKEIINKVQSEPESTVQHKSPIVLAINAQKNVHKNTPPKTKKRKRSDKGDNSDRGDSHIFISDLKSPKSSVKKHKYDVRGMPTNADNKTMLYNTRKRRRTRHGFDTLIND